MTAGSVVRIAVAIGALALSACTALPGNARVEDWKGGAAQAFGGLVQDPLNSPNSPKVKRRYIFNVHGMGATKQDYNEPMLQWLKSPGGYVIVADRPAAWMDAPLEPYVVRGEGLKCDVSSNPCHFNTFGKYQVTHFRRGAGEATEDVFVYTYFWNDDLWRVQGAYMDEDIARPHRALINGWLKRTLLDQGFSDAAAYLGPMNELVREGIREAVCVMLQDANTPLGQPLTEQHSAKGAATDDTEHVPKGDACLAAIAPGLHIGVDTTFSFVSHSLGSRMLLDALAPHAASQSPSSTNSDDAKTLLAGHTRTFFMAANQLPLLGLGQVTVQLEKDQALQDRDFSTCVHRTFLDLRCRDEANKRAAIPLWPLEVVAFQDPDDVLGFKANGAMMGLPDTNDPLRDVKFVSVSHRNTAQWLGIISNPSAAHDHELERKSATDLIFCGGTAASDGRLTPLPCTPR